MKNNTMKLANAFALTMAVLCGSLYSSYLVTS